MRVALSAFGILTTLLMSAGCTAYRVCDRGNWVGLNIGSGSLSELRLFPGDTVLVSARYSRGSRNDLGENCGEFLYDSQGRPTQFSWISTNPVVASVDAAGRVAGVALGSSFLRVEVGATSEVIPIEVLPRIASIRMTAAPIQPKVGDTLTVTVVGLDADGVPVSDAPIRPPTLSGAAQGTPWITQASAGGKFVVRQVGTIVISTASLRSAPPAITARLEIVAVP